MRHATELAQMRTIPARTDEERSADYQRWVLEAQRANELWRLLGEERTHWKWRLAAALLVLALGLWALVAASDMRSEARRLEMSARKICEVVR
jgi:hypothetical protein